MPASLIHRILGEQGKKLPNTVGYTKEKKRKEEEYALETGSLIRSSGLPFLFLVSQSTLIPPFFPCPYDVSCQ